MSHYRHKFLHTKPRMSNRFLLDSSCINNEKGNKYLLCPLTLSWLFTTSSLLSSFFDWLVSVSVTRRVVSVYKDEGAASISHSFKKI